MRSSRSVSSSITHSVTKVSSPLLHLSKIDTHPCPKEPRLQQLLLSGIQRRLEMVHLVAHVGDRSCSARCSLFGVVASQVTVRSLTHSFPVANALTQRSDWPDDVRLLLNCCFSQLESSTRPPLSGSRCHRRRSVKIESHLHAH